MIGKTISHYKILEKIGEGGMGEVYLAFDTELDREIVLKFLPKQFTKDDQAKERFKREAKAAAALNHPNIITVHEIGEYEGQFFIAMEYVKGASLRDMIERGPLQIDEVLNIATQVCDGLHKAHEAGIVHRDIKPENILLDEDGRVKILDFGLAKLKGATKLTKESSTPGTVYYMSPEQVMGEDTDFRTDIWSLGVVMYEMLIGELPFKGDFDQVVLYAIKTETPRALKDPNAEIPDVLKHIVDKALAKDPKDRYHQMEQLQNDLNTFGTDSGIFKKPYRIKTARTKRKKIISYAATTLIFLIVGFLIFRIFYFKKDLATKPIPIAVISFENQTNDSTYNYLQNVIPNLLITSLEQSPRLQVTTWERMHDLLKRRGFENIDLIDRDLGFDLCRLDSVNTIVLGSVTRMGDIFSIDAKVLDVNTKQLLTSTTSKGLQIESIINSQIDEISTGIRQFFHLQEEEIKTTQLSVADIATNSLQAYQSYLKGKEAFYKTYYDQAIKYFERAIHFDSTFAIAYYDLSRCLINPVERNEAILQAKRFADNSFEKEKLYINARYFRLIEEDNNKNIKTLELIAEKYPQDKENHFELGFYYRRLGRYDEAIESLEQAIQLDPSFGIAINQLGLVYIDMGDFNNALTYLQRYASVCPKEALPFASLGYLYLCMGQLEEAIHNFKKASLLSPGFSGWWIAYVYALQEDYQQTFKWIDQFIDVHSTAYEKAVGHFYRGLYYNWTGRFQECFSELNKAEGLCEFIEAGALIRSAHGYRAIIYYDLDEFELSRKSVEIYSNYKITVNSDIALGFIDLKEAQYDSVQVRLARITSKLPSFSPDLNFDTKWQTVYCELLYGELLLSTDNITDAVKVFSSVPELDIPNENWEIKVITYNIPFIRDGLPRAYLKAGKIERAIQEYERLITFDPNSKNRRIIHPKYHYRLAKLYEEKGEIEKARKEYEKFLAIWNEADEDLPEKKDAQNRLENLLQIK